MRATPPPMRPASTSPASRSPANKHLSREEIFATAGVTGHSSLLFLDVADARARLKTNPWIADATVQKLYPDRLQITITERAAFALWQKDGRVGVIADDGTVLEPYISRHRFVGLPLFVGDGAAARRQGFPRAARPLSGHPRPAARLRPGGRAALEPAAQERHRRAAAGSRRRARARPAGRARPRQEAAVARHRRDRPALARPRDRAPVRRRRARRATRRSKPKKPKPKGGNA